MKKLIASLVAALALMISAPVMAQDNALEGLEIQLKNADGKVVKTCVTKKDGTWSFDNLEAGDYTLYVEGQKITKSRSNIQNNRVALMKAKEKANRSVVSTASADVDGDGLEEISFTLNFNEITYDVKSPRDAATGQASGKRTHKPVTFVKEWNATTPVLFNVTAAGGTVSGAAGYDLAVQKK